MLFFITWKTWHNRHLVSESIADELLRLLPGLATLEGARVIELAVIPDHVHLVARTTILPDLPSLLQRLKGGSSRIINRDRSPDPKLRWAPGYDARTVGRIGLIFVQRYLDRQAVKHGYKWQRRYSFDPLKIA